LRQPKRTATRFLAALVNAVDGLLHSPLIGPRREIFASGLRVAFHSPYAIYCMPTAQELVVGCVSHGARDVAALAGRGGFD